MKVTARLSLAQKLRNHLEVIKRLPSLAMHIPLVLGVLSLVIGRKTSLLSDCFFVRKQCNKHISLALFKLRHILHLWDTRQ